MGRSESSFDIRGVDDVLSHYGKKGMHWGVITNKINPDRSVPKEVVLKETPGKLVKTRGGQFHPASEDARVAAAGRQMIKKSSIDVLSNKDLQAVITRMNLEQQYSNLKKNPRTKTDHGKKFIKKHGKTIAKTGYGMKELIVNDPRKVVAKKVGRAVIQTASDALRNRQNQQKKKKK